MEGWFSYDATASTRGEKTSVGDRWEKTKVAFAENSMAGWRGIRRHGDVERRMIIDGDEECEGLEQHPHHARPFMWRRCASFDRNWPFCTDCEQEPATRMVNVHTADGLPITNLP